MEIKRQEKALREFKEIIADLVTLLRKSTGASTAYIYWVNRARRQFVMEASSTTHSNVMFPDRVPFSEHFLFPYIDSRTVNHLQPEAGLDTGQLTHYYERVPISALSIVPFVNNDETVALTVLEAENLMDSDHHEAALHSYNNALANVLNTYLELTDLQEKEGEWSDYEESLDRISPRLHRVDILYDMLSEMKRLIPRGGVSLIVRGMEVWCCALNAPESIDAPPLGRLIDEKSIAYDSLKSGRPEFTIHFNQSPRRLSSAETDTDGATLAVPLMIDDRRHGTVLSYSRNALEFNESVKHKLINLVRVGSLAIKANLDKLSMDEDLLTSAYGSFIPDLWEKAIGELMGSAHPSGSNWFGLIAIENLQTLRSKHRLESLKELQRSLVTSINPSRFGKNGYIGFYSDYVFSFLLQDPDGGSPEAWLSEIERFLKNPVNLQSGEKIDVEIRVGYIPVDGEERELHRVVQGAKKALSEALKESLLSVSYANLK